MPYKDRQRRSTYHRDYYLAHSDVGVRYGYGQHVGNSVSIGVQRIHAYEILGGQCIVCGESDPMVLEFNHKDGGGKSHREALDSNRVHGSNFVKWILEHPAEAQERLELLCANCHARSHSLYNRVEGYQQRRY